MKDEQPARYELRTHKSRTKKDRPRGTYIRRKLGAFLFTVQLHKPDQAVQFSHAVLERGARKTPFEFALELKSRFGSVGASLFDVVSFVELEDAS